eukprot:190307-Alexandrium_andersonii.AAC.1
MRAACLSAATAASAPSRRYVVVLGTSQAAHAGRIREHRPAVPSDHYFPAVGGQPLDQPQG